MWDAQERFVQFKFGKLPRTYFEFEMLLNIYLFIYLFRHSETHKQSNNHVAGARRRLWLPELLGMIPSLVQGSSWPGDIYVSISVHSAIILEENKG